MKEKTPIGWREWIALPELGIPRVKAKIDTGARTSALHALDVEPFARAGRNWVRFRILPLQGDAAQPKSCKALVKDRRIVRDSGGHEELRYVIDTVIAIGDDRFRAEMTLTDRDTMAFRLLLGRTALRARYVIHPGQSYLRGNPSKDAKSS